MRVSQLGTGPTELAIVGGIHGDEPCGVAAIDRLLESDIDVTRPVKLVVANEAALARDERYIDTDLNRAFHGDTDPDTHEHQLARDLAHELDGHTVLAIHSTQSHDAPFGIVNSLADPIPRICSALPIESVVLVETVEGRLFAASITLIEVEAGRQGSQAAADNAYEISLAFMAATGATDQPTQRRSVPLYRLGESVAKEPAATYEILVNNFERVDPGQAYAVAGDDHLTADAAFYPILMSPYGYADQFGYTGEYLGTIDPAGTVTPPPSSRRTGDESS